MWLLNLSFAVYPFQHWSMFLMWFNIFFNIYIHLLEGYCANLFVARQEGISLKFLNTR
jgi:hypothetical protein